MASMPPQFVDTHDALAAQDLTKSVDFAVEVAQRMRLGIDRFAHETLDAPDVMVGARNSFVHGRG